MLRSTTFVDSEVLGCSFDGAVAEDVVIDGLSIVDSPMFVRGCEFTRTTLKGRVKGTLVLAWSLLFESKHLVDVYGEWLRERFASDEWMLDISQATGEIEVRGYPSRLIRHDSAIHAVVPRERAEGVDYEVLVGDTTFGIGIADAIKRGWEDALLIANPRSRKFAAELEAIARLREAGIALLPGESPSDVGAVSRRVVREDAGAESEPVGVLGLLREVEDLESGEGVGVAEVEALASRFGQLPVDYARFVSEFGWASFHGYDLWGVADGSRPDMDVRVMDDTLRARGGMPADLLAFMDNTGGQVACIATAGRTDGVWSYDLDTRQVERIADSFDDFLRILIDSTGGQ